MKRTRSSRSPSPFPVPLPYGTPLPTLKEESRAQRLHGAFTGGFSAGYFNTVGTKEGTQNSNAVG